MNRPIITDITPREVVYSSDLIFHIEGKNFTPEARIYAGDTYWPAKSTDPNVLVTGALPPQIGSGTKTLFIENDCKDIPLLRRSACRSNSVDIRVIPKIMDVEATEIASPFNANGTINIIQLRVLPYLAVRQNPVLWLNPLIRMPKPSGKSGGIGISEVLKRRFDTRLLNYLSDGIAGPKLKRALEGMNIVIGDNVTVQNIVPSKVWSLEDTERDLNYQIRANGPSAALFMGLDNKSDQASLSFTYRKGHKYGEVDPGSYLVRFSPNKNPEGIDFNLVSRLHKGSISQAPEKDQPEGVQSGTDKPAASTKLLPLEYPTFHEPCVEVPA